jgi:hypothetical protein
MNFRYLSFVLAALVLSVSYMPNTASASIITLEFDVTNVMHYEYNIKEYSDDRLGNYLGLDLVENLGSSSLSVSLDSSVLSSYINTYSLNHIDLGYYGDQTNSSTRFSGIDMVFSQDIESELRSRDPQYNNNSNSHNYINAYQNYSDYNDSVSYTDRGYKSMQGREYQNSSITSYSYDHNNIIEEINGQYFNFNEGISFGFKNDFDSLLDPEIYTIDALLADLYTGSGFYNMDQSDYQRTITYTDGEYSHQTYARGTGDRYTGNLKLKSVNGISSDVYFAEVPEPSTLAIFALGMIGLASRRFNKQS